MQTRCRDCGVSFLITPSGVTQSAACPDCGGTRLERDQPSPVKSDGEMSASNPGMGINQQGIPEREGIFGGDSDSGIDTGWQPLRRRDESFASVKTANTPQHTFPVESGMIHNGNIHALQWFDTHINGQSLRGTGVPFWRGGRDEPIQVSVHHPEHEPAVQEIIENGAGMTGPPSLSKHAPGAMEMMRAIGRGEVPPPVGADIDKVSKISFDFNMDDFEPDESGKNSTHKFIVDGSGKVYSKPEPTWHEDIAEHHNLINPDFPKGLSQGILHDNGEVSFLTHDTPHGAEALSQMLYGHFGHPVAIDPNLKPTTSEERFKINTPETRDVRDIRRQSPEREQDMIDAQQARGGRPFGYYDNPFINRGGSTERSLNMDPYMPWTHEAAEKLSIWPILVPIAEALAGGGAAAAGAEAGGAGLLGGLMGGVMRGGAMQAGMNALKGQQPGGFAGGPSSPPAGIPVDESRLTHHIADLVTPTTNPGYFESPDGDTKQFSVGDHDPAAQNPNLPGEAGGSALGEDGVREHAGFAPDSAGVERAQMLLPLLLHYYHSDESGENDPLIKSLHEQLEQEAPGYLDHGDEEAVERWLKNHQKPGVHAAAGDPWGYGAGSVPDTFDTRPEGPAFAQQPQNALNQPGVCPYCQGRQAVDGSCPTCGAKGPDASKAQIVPNISGGAQGPAMTHPKQSVPPPGYHGKVATGGGHCEHCGGVTSADGSCPQCGAQVPSIENPGKQAPNIQTRVAADHQGPTTPEQISAVQQYLIDNGRVDEVPTVPLRPELYANELSEVNGSEEPPPTIDPSQTPPPQPTQEIAPPGATMPVPNPASPQMQQPLAKVAAPEESAIDNQIAVPSADQEGQRDVEHEQDSSHTWQTDSGEPLQSGQVYEMHSEKYEIPDIVKVLDVKPASLTVETVGEYSADPNKPANNYQYEITHEEADLEGLAFIPHDGQHENANGPENGQPEPLEAPVNTEPAPVSEQHETRASVQNTEIDDDACPKCSSNQITSSMSSATTNFHECYRCGNAWETKEEDFSTDGSNLAAWILEDNGPAEDNFFAEMERARASGTGSRNLSDIVSKDPRYQAIRDTLNEEAMQREAGRKFTPKEQREFIDERGVARNADKLDLSGTHYESRHRYLDKANGENVDDAHLFMGI